MRGYRNGGGAIQGNFTPSMFERLIAVLSYLTAGMVGFIWYILSYITGKKLRPFIKYHAFQAIFISILVYVIGLIANILMGVLQAIPFIGSLVLGLVYYIAHMPLILGYSALHFALLMVIGYLIMGSIQGKYSELPWVSDTIKRMV